MEDKAQATHPDLDRLLAYTRGELNETGEHEIEAHLGECEACCRRLEGMPDDTIVSLLREPDGVDTAPTHPTSPSASQLPVGTPIDPEAIPKELREHPKYEILGVLGHGGMGHVYKALHRVMNRTVALKVIKRRFTANPETVDRFQREVEAAAQLSHPNIVTAYDAERAGDLHFLAMEYVDGVDLHHVLAERGPLPVAEACDYVRQAALGLQHAFERGMVHRDIKPHNLMVSSEGQVKILDFGLANFVTQTAAEEISQETREPQSSLVRQLTSAGTVMGTPDFIAPEQADDPHAADIRADIYSLGCTFYALLTGQAPFQESSAEEKVLAHSKHEPAPMRQLRDDVPAEVEKVVQRMMAKDPAERYQTPTEVAEALLPFAARASSPRAESSLVRSRRWLVAGAAVLLVLAALAAVFYLRTPHGTVRVEINDPEITAEIGGHSITIGNSGEPIRIEPGQHKLIVERGDLRFETDTFELRRGAESVMRVTYHKDKIGVSLDGMAISEFDAPPREEPGPNDIAEVGRFEGHLASTSNDSTLAVSTDGRFMLSAGGTDCSVRLWDVERRKPVCLFVGHTTRASCVAFSPDGQFAASGDWDSNIFLWEIATGKRLWHVKASEPRSNEANWARITAMVFSPDGTLLASGDGGGIASIRDAASGKEIDRLRACDGCQVNSIAFVPPGKSLIVSTSWPLWHWNIDSGKCTLLPKGGARSISVSADGKRLLTGHSGYGNLVRLWNLTTLEEIRAFAGIDPISSVRFLPGEEYIISGSRHGTIRLWDVSTGREIACKGRMGHLANVVLPLPDGRLAVSCGYMYTGAGIDPHAGDVAIRLWQLPECVWPNPSPKRCAAAQPSEHESPTE